MVKRTLVLVIVSVLLFNALACGGDWPQWRGPNRDGVWRESGIIQKFESRQLGIRWRASERGELIISKLSPKGFHEISRAKLINPTQGQLSQRGGVCWSHPAFAYKHIYIRNDEELVCADLSAEN